MEKLLNNHLDKLDKLSDSVEEDAIESLLQIIDIDELLKDPEGYFLELSDAFINRHIKKIEKAAELGTKHARQMIK